jgi:hypothetical protein
VPWTWRPTITATAIALFATVAWGIFTGHGEGGPAYPPVVSPFNAAWSTAVGITALGAGVFLAIPVAWNMARHEAPLEADLYLGTMVLVVAGAIGWGALLGTFTRFYLYFAGIAVFATPLAAVAVRRLWRRLRETRRLRLTAFVVVICGIQLVVGTLTGLLRVQLFGPNDYAPIPVSLLAVIRQLPADARLAYACQPFEEVSYGTQKLLSIDAHTGRRVVPMCFEAEILSVLIGAPASAQAPGLGFLSAPQRTLYPDSTARPSSDAVAAFLKAHGIDYIYADAAHPNTLVADAVPVTTSGAFELLRVP